MLNILEALKLLMKNLIAPPFFGITHLFLLPGDLLAKKQMHEYY